MTKYECGGGACKTYVSRPEGPLSLCLTHYWLEDVLQSEHCSTVADLSRIRERMEFARARIADLLRRTGVEDAEDLIGCLSRI